jgi:hypothetical protein
MDEIKSSYNSLIKNETDLHKITLLNKAYSILSDYHKRRLYDDKLETQFLFDMFTPLTININNKNVKPYFYEQVISQNTINNNGKIQTIKKIYTNNNGDITQKIITPENNLIQKPSKIKYKLKKIDEQIY